MSRFSGIWDDEIVLLLQEAGCSGLVMLIMLESSPLFYFLAFFTVIIYILITYRLFLLLSGKKDPKTYSFPRFILPCQYLFIGVIYCLKSHTAIRTSFALILLASSIIAILYRIFRRN